MPSTKRKAHLRAPLTQRRTRPALNRTRRRCGNVARAPRTSSLSRVEGDDDPFLESSYSMKIAIIGAGGIGGFLGAMLARAGHSVSLLARGPHLAAIAQSGLQLESRQFGSFTVTPAATDDPAKLGRNDLVFITVKMNDFEEAAHTAKSTLTDD